MTKLFACFVALLAMCMAPQMAAGQNWVLSIRDASQATPINQVNGVSGGMGTVYATILNFTGTPASDDGTGQPAPSTLLDFAGLSFTRNPGQDDLAALFVPAPSGFGYPQVPGSLDGIAAGSSGMISLGYFNLFQIVKGTYKEDFVAQAFSDDFLSSVQFEDIYGTLTLNVTPSVPTVPEPASSVYAVCVLLGVTTWLFQKHARRSHIGDG